MTGHLKQLQNAFTQSATQAHHQIGRIQAELRFADALCELHPEQAGQWKPLLAEAAETVRQAVARGGAGEIEQAVHSAEKILAPVGEVAKSYTIYCIGHAHIDMNWQWSWPETVAVTNDTFTTVLRLMDEFPEFRFSQSQASVYAIIEKHNPELLKQIAERVAEGRWEVTASHWVEGDKNLAGGESLCRHLLYTRRYMQKLFGLKPEDVPIDWSPDTFGHAVTVPTYLVRGGVKYLYLHRPGASGPRRPEAFWWQGPDGSRVLVRNDMASGYNGQITPAITRSLLRFTRETGLPFSMFVYGVGDHGGGPTRRDILYALDMGTWPVFPQIRFATAREFYDRLAAGGKDLPVLDCELNFEFTGCYTSQSLIKKANRFAEKRLAAAETAAVLASTALQIPYPGATLEEAWQDTLFSHFHDILPGSGVRDTRTYTHGMYQKTMAATSMEETKALRQLAARVDTSPAGVPEPQEVPPSRLATAMGSGAGFGTADGALSEAEQSAGHGNRPLVIFNPTAMDREEVIEATIWDNAWGWRTSELSRIPFSVKTPDGDAIAAQTVDTGSYWGHDYVRLAFPVKVAGFGYGLYTVVQEESNNVSTGAKQLGFDHHCPYSAHERSPEGLENEFISLEVDTTTGGILSLADKRSDVVLVDPGNPAPVLEYALERPHGMTSWRVDHTGPAQNPEVLGIHRRLNGPYKASVDVRLRLNQSEFTLTYELKTGDPNLYLHLTGTWFERGTRETGVPVLRAAFPLNLTNCRARYEIPFGAINRDMKHGEEVPALRWAQVTGDTNETTAGCLLLNDSKHGHSLDGSTLRLTLLRSSYDPDPLPETGEHEIHLALRPFTGDMSVADAIQAGQVFENELRVISTDVHTGSLPAQSQMIDLQPGSVIVSGLKKAEEEDALILRLVETAGEKATATVRFNGDILGKVDQAAEVDLLEREIEESTVKPQGDNAIAVDVPPYGISSIWVRLKK